jgi:hypothetical protein
MSGKYSNHAKSRYLLEEEILCFIIEIIIEWIHKIIYIDQ